MSVRAAVISQILQIRENTKKEFPPLTDDLILVDSGLDSLAIAIIVARLEDTLGVDPFTEFDDAAPPVTLGEFIQFYENAAKLSAVDSRPAV
jgi:acyl carrier protein